MVSEHSKIHRSGGGKSIPNAFAVLRLGRMLQDNRDILSIDAIATLTDSIARSKDPSWETHHPSLWESVEGIYKNIERNEKAALPATEGSYKSFNTLSYFEATDELSCYQLETGQRKTGRVELQKQAPHDTAAFKCKKKTTFTGLSYVPQLDGYTKLHRPFLVRKKNTAKERSGHRTLLSTHETHDRKQSPNHVSTNLRKKETKEQIDLKRDVGCETVAIQLAPCDKKGALSSDGFSDEEVGLPSYGPKEKKRRKTKSDRKIAGTLTKAEIEFDTNITRLSEYKRKNNHTHVQTNEISDLSAWCTKVRQERAVDELSDFQKRALDNLDFEWGIVNAKKFDSFLNNIEGFEREVHKKKRPDVYKNWYCKQKILLLNKEMSAPRMAVLEQSNTFTLLLHQGHKSTGLNPAVCSDRANKMGISAFDRLEDTKLLTLREILALSSGATSGFGSDLGEYFEKDSNQCLDSSSSVAANTDNQMKSKFPTSDNVAK